MIRANPGTIAWARTAADVRANAKRGRISALFGVEGGHALLPGNEAEMLEHLRTFYERGARYLTLTWSVASPIGGSSGDDSDGRGLTDVGRRILDEMERLGMMVDVSHVSDPLFWDAIRYARKPVIASHSSAHELANVPRNMTDAMLKAVAQNGGAVCVNFGSSFLDRDFAAGEQAAWARARTLGLPPKELWRTVRDEVSRLPPVPLSRLVDHVDHVAKVAGIDHVCLGSDFDGVPANPRGAGGRVEAARAHRRAAPARLRPGRRREDPRRQRPPSARRERAHPALRAQARRRPRHSSMLVLTPSTYATR